ncbi:hypothetical protein N9P93_01755 [Gammaproteobacteria bacterium]|nr:hypothetical protein [Gammaproteobacteria bacterium]
MLDSCNVPNKIKGIAIGIISVIRYFPEIYLTLLSASFIKSYSEGQGYELYYLILSATILVGAYSAYLLSSKAIK